MLGYLKRGIQCLMAQGQSIKIISMITWIQTSRLSIKNSLALSPTVRRAVVPERRVQGYGFRLQSLGFRVQGSGFKVQGSGFRVQGSGCRVQGSGNLVGPRGLLHHSARGDRPAP